jgi:ATP-dependent DNA helicase RecG
MLDNIDNAVNFVKAHTTTAYKIEKIQREEIHDVPEIALREAIVNAFCHRNYFQEGANISVEIFADRVVVVSPGGLPSGLDKEEFGYKSVRRNHLIADLLARAGYIEKAGTGIGRIRQDAEQNHCRYEINYTQDWFTVTFYRQSSEKIPDNPPNYPVRVGVNEINDGENVGVTDGENIYQHIVNQYNLSNSDKYVAILKHIAGNKYNAQKLSEILNINKRTLERYLHKLQQLGIIEFVGAAKNGYYKINNWGKSIN